MNFFCVYRVEVIMDNYILHENITDDELQDVFEGLRATQQTIAYRNKYYESIKDSYVYRLFLTTAGEFFVTEVFKKRNPTQEEIDGAYFFIKKGYSVVFLSEAGEGQHPDALINGILVEFKTVRSGIANSISNRVKQAVNKDNTEIPAIFLVEQGLNANYQMILESIKERITLKNFKRELIVVLFIKGQEATVIKKYAR